MKDFKFIVFAEVLGCVLWNVDIIYDNVKLMLVDNIVEQNVQSLLFIFSQSMSDALLRERNVDKEPGWLVLWEWEWE